MKFKKISVFILIMLAMMNRVCIAESEDTKTAPECDIKTMLDPIFGIPFDVNKVHYNMLDIDLVRKISNSALCDKFWVFSKIKDTKSDGFYYVVSGLLPIYKDTDPPELVGYGSDSGWVVYYDKKKNIFKERYETYAYIMDDKHEDKLPDDIRAELIKSAVNLSFKAYGSKAAYIDIFKKDKAHSITNSKLVLNQLFESGLINKKEMEEQSKATIPLL